MADLAAAYADCEALLRAEDRDAWLAALLAPAEARPALHAIGAFALEAARVKARVRQPVAGEIRLQWWQDVVDGSRATEAAAHPVAAALLDAVARRALPAAAFGDLLDAHRMALYDEPPADLPALERRLDALRGTPIRLAARALGGGEAGDVAAGDAGVALGLADALDALRGDARPALPVELLARHGAAAEVAAGRDGPGARAAATELREAARDRLAALRAARGALGPAAPAFVQAALVEPRLRRGERVGDPFRPMPELPQWRRQWRMWRASRRF